MAGPARDPETGEFLQPGLCPINTYSGQRECPPATEIDCLLVEKVFDQCWKEEDFVRNVVIPTGKGKACENVDTTQVDRIECEVVDVVCEVVSVGPPLPDTNNLRVVTIEQTVTIQVELWNDTPTVPVLLCSFTQTFDEVFNQVVLYVPPSGLLFGAEGGPFVFCEVTNFACMLAQGFIPGTPFENILFRIKICKIIEVTAFVKLMVPVLGFCVPRQCEAAPQAEEIVCPPINELFPPQPDDPELNVI